jgi:hypothetical protein
MKFKIRVKFRELEASVLESWLVTFEEALKMRLPEDYRNHILKYNGGKPIKENYAVFDHDLTGVIVDETIIIKSFNYLDNGEGSLDRQIRWGGTDYISKGIDIGSTYGGILMMSLAAGEIGSIYHMFSYGEPQKIANSWSEFVSHLVDKNLDE